MTDAPINVLQQLMRGWETQHPYNAAQVMTVAPGASVQHWADTWQETVGSSGLGALHVSDNRYRFDAAPPTAVVTITGSLDEHLSCALNQPFVDGESALRPFVRVEANRSVVGLVYRHWIADSRSIQQLMACWFRGAFGLPGRPFTLRLPDSGFWRNVGPGRQGWSVPIEAMRLTRQYLRLRRATKVAGTGIDQQATRFTSVSTPPGLIAALRPICATRGLTMNDLFLATLLETCAALVPIQRRGNRPDFAVGCIADLRRRAKPAHFGLLLGFLIAVARPGDRSNFEELLHVVARQTRRQKTDGVGALSLLWLAAGSAATRVRPANQIVHFYRKVFPLLGGLSNVDLTPTWATERPDLLWSYQRVSPTGPMVPLVLTTTTLGDQLQIGLTHRTGLIPPPLATRIGEHFVNRLVETSRMDQPATCSFEASRVA